MPAFLTSSSLPRTKFPSLVRPGVTRLFAGAPNLVKNHPVSLTTFPRTSANLVNLVTRFTRSASSLVTSGTTGVPKLIPSFAAPVIA